MKRFVGVRQDALGPEKLGWQNIYTGGCVYEETGDVKPFVLVKVSEGPRVW